MFPEGSWEGRIVEFMHIKSIPVKLKQELKLAADLQASFLLWGRISELVYMQGCWPSNCFQHCGSWWIQMICMSWEPASQKMFNRESSVVQVSHFRRILKALHQPCVWHSHELGTAQSNVAGGGDVAMATTAQGQVATLTEPGGQLFNGPKRKKNDWQAQPIKHEVECEGMQRPLFNKHLRNARRTFFIFSCCYLILLSD